MKKENLVPKIDGDLRIAIINDALPRKTKKIIIFWNKGSTFHFGYNLLESENEKSIIIEKASSSVIYVETINVEEEVKRYAFIGESKINYDTAWFPVEPDEPDEEKIKAQMESFHRT